MRPARLMCTLCLCLSTSLTVIPTPAHAASSGAAGAPTFGATAGTGDFGPCSLAALGPNKVVASPSYMEAHAVFWCDNNLPKTCTIHVNLQQWSEYFKVWTNVHGHDSWYHACPPRLGARKEMRSVPFKCLEPQVLYGFRTVVSGSVVWPNGSDENHTSTGTRFNFYC
jgi:hypothetical protein